MAGPVGLAAVVMKFPQEARDKYDFSNALYVGANVRITGIICPDHGEFSQYAARFRKGSGCPQCGHDIRGVNRRMPAQEYLAVMNASFGGRYDYSEAVYDDMNANITVRCPTHGYFTLNAGNHYYRKQGCGQCENEAKKTRIVQYRHLSAASKIANTAKSFFELCRARHEERYVYPEQEYEGAKKKIRILCSEHGEFQQAAWKHLQGQGCPKCGAADPAWERELVFRLEELGLTVQRSVPLLQGRHIDVYLPDLKVGIELHGLWCHTEATRSPRYHREKWECADAQGIRLIQVFEDEWADRGLKGIIWSRICTLVGKTDALAARRCTVEQLSSEEGKRFLDGTHLQGAGNAQVYYGLRFSGSLFAVASFGRARSGAMTPGVADVWEVMRYASVGRVQGGFGRLFSRFIADWSPIDVVSYCDLRFGDGGLYRATGFSLDSITEPDYWWVPRGKVQRIPRYQTQKHKLAKHPVLREFYDPLKTELQICNEAGWSRIYGVGHQKWLWTKPTAPL